MIPEIPNMTCYKDSTKFLEVTFDKNISWTERVKMPV